MKFQTGKYNTLLTNESNERNLTLFINRFNITGTFHLERALGYYLNIWAKFRWDKAKFDQVKAGLH